MKFNLLYFIRLFSKHICFIISMPILLAIVVFLFARNVPRTYVSQTTIYTSLASGSSLDLSTMTLNTVNTAFDNLIGTISSRETIEEVGLRLFASHLLLDQPNQIIIRLIHLQELNYTTPNEIKQLKVPGDFEKTYENLKEFKDKTKQNYLTNLLLENRYYGANKILQKLRIRRLQSSDNIELSYECDDPGICQNTLLFLIDVFKKNYVLKKLKESNNAVAYYEAEVARAAEKLKISEDELLEFNQQNRIINYNEQSKFIAARKEAFESGYQDVLKTNSGAKAVIELLEKKMTPMEKQKLAGSHLLDLRQQLASVNQQLAMESLNNSLNDEKSPVEQSKYQKLSQQAFELKQQMKSSVDSLYNLTNSTKGIPGNTILSDWLSNVIEYENTSAQITTLSQLREEFDKIYARFAPMGAQMRRLERKIGVNEDEYITLIKNLGLVKLKEQGISASSGFSVVDAPVFPTIPEPDKRKILILAAGLAGLFLSLFIILTLDLLDPSLRNAYRAEKNIGIQVDAIFPLLKSSKKEVENLLFVEQKSIETLVRKILFNGQYLTASNKVRIITLFSTRNQEGKSFLAERIIKYLNKIGEKALWIKPSVDTKTDDTDHCRMYEFSNDFIRLKSFENLKFIENTPVNVDYSIILLELPSIIYSSYPIHLMEASDHNYLVCRANRSWSEADTSILAEIKELLKNDSKLSVILTGVSLDEMESVLGEMPKKRSWIRRLLKKIIARQSNTKSIT
jgi:polysaccharide biosynthesis transport protein